MSDAGIIKILIVEDHQIIRIGLKLLLEKMENFQVVGEAEDGNAAIARTLELRPDVVLMDIGLPGVDGVEASFQIKGQCPQTRVIMLTSHDADDDILAAMGAGADGYCLKDIPAEQLADAIRAVMQDGTWLDPRIAERLLQTRQVAAAKASPDSPALTAECLDLLCYVEQGLSNEEIAVEMGMSIDDLRSKMRQALEVLFLSDDTNQSGKQLRKQFAAKLGDVAIESEQAAVLSIGDVFAEKYLIKAQIGRGGMGRVYKALHMHTDRVVAIKVLLPQFASDRRVVRLFQEEAKAAAALVHPNTVQIYDFGITKEGQSFLVMDYIEGTSFESILRRDRFLDPHRFYSIFDQVCDALIAAHSKDIIHCDIKPSNIVLLPNKNGADVVKLIDFGLAKILPPPASGIQMQLTDSFEVCGSPAYMSPEQCRGGKMDARSDLYSLGCIMYEALTGKQAAAGTQAMECIAKHLQELPPRFDEACPERRLPKALEHIVFALLQKIPEARFQSALQVKQALAVSYREQIALVRGANANRLAPAKAANA
ncbi:MAG TPA: response regulator [Drouetiella sp.]